MSESTKIRETEILQIGWNFFKKNFMFCVIYLLDKMLKDKFKDRKIGLWQPFDQFAQFQNFDTTIRNYCKKNNVHDKKTTHKMYTNTDPFWITYLTRKLGALSKREWLLLYLHDMVSSSAIWSGSKIEGKRLKKKSLTAVATAFTAMSSSSISTLGSSSNFWKSNSTWARLPGTL